MILMILRVDRTVAGGSERRTTLEVTHLNSGRYASSLPSASASPAVAAGPSVSDKEAQDSRTSLVHANDIIFVFKVTRVEVGCRQDTSCQEAAAEQVAPA
jgi:hypothetical protein